MGATGNLTQKLSPEEEQRFHRHRGDTGDYSFIRHRRCKTKASWPPLPDSRQQLRAQFCSNLYHKTEAPKKLGQQQQLEMNVKAKVQLHNGRAEGGFHVSSLLDFLLWKEVICLEDERLSPFLSNVFSSWMKTSFQNEKVAVMQLPNG